MNYPPFCDIICIMAVGEDEEKVDCEIGKVTGYFSDAAKENREIKDIIGPVAAPIAKIKNNYRYRLLVKCTDTESVMDLLRKIYEEYEKGKHGVMLSIDINPVNMY